MAKRYIDVDRTLKNLLDDLPYKASVKRVLMQAPEADVVEVKHGEWKEMVEHEHGGIKKFFFECSLCGRIECQKEPYCHCGAKMDGRREI